jgi:hypothetical protein
MARKPARKKAVEASGQSHVKVTLRLSAETATRLGVEAVMTRKSQSSIVEAVLLPHLQRWRLPSNVGTVESADSKTSAA